jgi:hypothetical protein
MNSKTLLVTGLATAVLLAAGVYLSEQGASPSATSHDRHGPLFSELRSRVNDVAEVTIVSGASSCTLKKSGATWGAADKGGFPVDFGKVKALVVGISELEKVEAMTRNREFHSKLGVEDAAGEGATSKRVTLKDASGAVLADVVLGKSKPTQGSSTRSTLYVRVEGDDQTWEATGSLSADASSTGWLDRNISKIEEKRVKRAAVTHPDGELVVATRSAQDQTNLSVENVPAGKELQWDGVANGIASSLQYMSLDDVQRAEGFDMAGAVQTEFACFDGLVVAARSIEKDGKTWVTLSASFDEAQRAAPAGPEAPPAEGEAATPPKPELKSIELVKKEVDELNARWSPWVFNVPGYNGANLRKRMNDLLKQDAPATGALEDDALEVIEPAPGQPVEDHTGHDHTDDATPPKSDGR